VTAPRGARVDRAQVIGGLVLAAVFATAYVLALRWPAQSGLYPRLVSLAGAALSFALVLVAVGRGLRPEAGSGPAESAATALSEQDDEDDPEALEYVFQTAGGGRWLRALSWIALFVAGLALLGLYVTTFVFTVLYLRLSAKASWLLTVVYAIVATAVLVVGTAVLLHVPVPEGFLPISP